MDFQEIKKIIKIRYIVFKNFAHIYLYFKNEFCDILKYNFFCFFVNFKYSTLKKYI